MFCFLFGDLHTDGAMQIQNYVPLCFFSFLPLQENESDMQKQVVLKESVILISFEREVNLNTVMRSGLEGCCSALTVFYPGLAKLFIAFAIGF